MCEVLDVSNSGYYASLDRDPSPRAERRSGSRRRCAQVHAESHGIYGSLKIAKRLAQQGDLESACRNTVARAMREMGLKSRVSQGLHADHDAGRSDETAGAEPARPRLHGDGAQSQVGDRHHLPADGRRLGLPGRGAGLVQSQGRRLVARGGRWKRRWWPRPCARRSKPDDRSASELLHHSDRGCQYTSDAYQQTLKTLGIECSMSRTGAVTITR